MALSSCETIQEIKENKILEKAGSFKLNPVKANTYWYDGKSWEYNAYEIEITSAPGRAHIILGDKYIGDTPFTYKFTGTLDRDERLSFRMIPFDEKIKQQESVLRVRDELPRKIFFDIREK
jgi:hypothetical protein